MLSNLDKPATFSRLVGEEHLPIGFLLLGAHEEELIDFYVEQLAMRGVRLDDQGAHNQYRGYSFQTLMVALTSMGLGTLTERDETVRSILRRLAAMDRLDLASWLEE